MAKMRNGWVVARLATATWSAKRQIAGWAIMLGLSAVLAAALSLTAIFSTHAGPVTIIACVLLPFSALACTPVIFPGDTRHLEWRARRLGEAVHGLQRDRAMLSPTYREYARQLVDANRLYSGIRKAEQYPLSRLLNANFNRMSGPEFEAFLASIFRLHGYRVRPTGKAGDQGVDLVVERKTITIAVQAKCYARPVSNAAVQQVYTGMRIYRCHRCVVITNSRFTNSAREAATKVGCLLIEGGDIRSLIRGRITL